MIVMNHHFQEVLDEGIKNDPQNVQFVAVHFSSWHMSVFYEYYATFDKLVEAKGYEYVCPMCYSRIRVVWDLKQNKLVYHCAGNDFYDVIGLIAAAEQYGEEHKDDTELKPKVVEPESFEPLTEEKLITIATKNSKHIKTVIGRS